MIDECKLYITDAQLTFDFHVINFATKEEGSVTRIRTHNCNPSSPRKLLYMSVLIRSIHSRVVDLHTVSLSGEPE